MKSVVKQPEPPAPAPVVYPSLRISNTRGSGLIVLFTARGKGFVVAPGNLTDFEIGKYLESWDGNFSDFDGEVTLRNK